MDEGYIVSHKFRRAIFGDIASGETQIAHIAKKHRIVHRVAQRIVDELQRHQLVEQQGTRYVLTEKGKKLKETIGY